MTDTQHPLAARIEGKGPAVIVAEAGVNHNGDLGIAHQLVDAAAEAGADVVKFQTFVPELVVASGAPSASYQERATGAREQAGFLASLVLPMNGWAELNAHAQESGVAFLSTAFDAPSIELLASLNPQLWKVPSGEITNLAMIQDLASRGKPLVISTGMSTLSEVARAVSAGSAAPLLALFHCVSAYPAPIEEANLRAIQTLHEEFAVPVGWSDHTLGTLTAIAAVALGVTILEKHLTLDRSLAGPDHQASADPREFAQYVAAVRSAEAALGTGEKVVTPSEVEIQMVARRSWHTARALDKGHVLRQGDLVALRPAGGIGPDVDLTGRRLRHPLTAGAKVRSTDLIEST